jgi:hypothetical protein
MLHNEKNPLLALFEIKNCWCQDAEARDASGDPVKFRDPLATTWDITSAICRLFGWKQACTLFGQRAGTTTTMPFRRQLGMD